MPSAKQQLFNINHGEGMRPKVCTLTFGPPCIMYIYYVNIILAGKSETHL